MADENTGSGPAQPFASVDDLAARWHSLTDTERTTATTLLADASDVIRTTVPTWAAASPDTLRRVTCAMVKRAMIAADNVGVSKASETVGPFANSWTFSNPGGDLYLTKMEKRSLGVSGQTTSAGLMGGNDA